MFPVCRNLSRLRGVFSSSRKSAAGIWSQDQTLTSRVAPGREASDQRFNVPPSAEFVARVSGIPTMAKLPYRDSADGLDAAFVGVPIDTGTSNRPGARLVAAFCPLTSAPPFTLQRKERFCFCFHFLEEQLR